MNAAFDLYLINENTHIFVNQHLITEALQLIELQTI